MVSQLSTRLMGGATTSGGTGGGSLSGTSSCGDNRSNLSNLSTTGVVGGTTASAAPVHETGATATQSSGYSADREGSRKTSRTTAGATTTTNTNTTSSKQTDAALGNSVASAALEAALAAVGGKRYRSRCPPIPQNFMQLSSNTKRRQNNYYNNGNSSSLSRPSRHHTATAATCFPPNVIDLLLSSRGGKQNRDESASSLSFSHASHTSGCTIAYTAEQQQAGTAASGQPQAETGSQEQQAGAEASEESAMKRQKLSEDIYNATAVQSDLERAGMIYPTLWNNGQATRQTLLGCINSRSVELVSSKFFDRMTTCPSDNGSKDGADTKVSDTTSTRNNTSCFSDAAADSLFASMISDCKSFYRLPKPQQAVPVSARGGAKRVDTASPDTESSTSSMTDTEGEENHNGNSTSDNDCLHRRRSYISMGEALSITKQPRVVALAFAPFLVVHVNAAYTRVTGLSSVQILGKPLHDLVRDDERAAAFLRNPITTIHSLLELDVRQRIWTFHTAPDKAAGHVSQAVCQVNVCPVGAENQVITHFALDLKEIYNGDDKDDDLDNQLVRLSSNNREQQQAENTRQTLQLSSNSPANRAAAFGVMA